jgi:hypothetical protein
VSTVPRGRSPKTVIRVHLARALRRACETEHQKLRVAVRRVREILDDPDLAEDPRVEQIRQLLPPLEQRREWTDGQWLKYFQTRILGRYNDILKEAKNSASRTVPPLDEQEIDGFVQLLSPPPASSPAAQQHVPATSAPIPEGEDFDPTDIVSQITGPIDQILRPSREITRSYRLLRRRRRR